MRRAAVLALLAFVIAVPTAGARPQTIKKSMWGPSVVDGRSQFPIYADLGVGLWQHSMSWASVAPTRPSHPRDPADPAYHWPSELDGAMRAAARQHIKVSLMLIFAPPWANGGRDQRWAPKRAQDFADFATAAARRYPTVHRWMIWGEPTKASNFQPLSPSRGGVLKGKALAGAHKYAQILDRSYAALKRRSRRNLVIGGNTYTTGTVAPFAWVRSMRLPNGRRPRMDLWGHNPFSARVPRLQAPPLSSGYADFSDLDQLAAGLDRAYRHAPLRRERHLKLFLSEYSLPTDHANFEFNFFVNRATQARWLSEALHIARTYRRIYTLGYLSLYDDALRPDGEQVERGLITRAGERKPAYRAFRDG